MSRGSAWSDYFYGEIDEDEYANELEREEARKEYAAEMAMDELMHGI